MAEQSPVVLQASGGDPELLLSAWRSALNLLAVLPGTPVEIVVQGAAVTGLVEGHHAADELSGQRPEQPEIHVLACRNALNAHHVDESELAAGIQVVPAGIAWLVQRQREGWAYVRVG